jgi:hypothetical protein
MNERIKELYIQAAQEHRAAKAPEHGPIDEPTMNRILEMVFDTGCGNRFAELIVRECIAKYDEWAGESSDQTSFRMARHNVKKHFGVES